LPEQNIGFAAKKSKIANPKSKIEKMPTRRKDLRDHEVEDAQIAVELGAAALGFNFYPPSPRYIDPPAARAII